MILVAAARRAPRIFALIVLGFGVLLAGLGWVGSR